MAAPFAKLVRENARKRGLLSIKHRRKQPHMNVLDVEVFKISESLMFGYRVPFFGDFGFTGFYQVLLSLYSRDKRTQRSQKVTKETKRRGRT